MAVCNRFLCLLLFFALAGCVEWRPPPEPHFQSPVRNFAKWERVRDAERKNPSFTATGLDGLDAKKNAQWRQLCDTAKDRPPVAILAQVNAFFNQWPYTEDAANGHAEDHWATPREFARRSGDCEDYAIAKYYALRFLGLPADQLRIAAVWNRRRGEGHALLLVTMPTGSLLLDCTTDALLTWEKAPHYLPQFFVNEDFLWQHEAAARKGK